MGAGSNTVENDYRDLFPSGLLLVPGELGVALLLFGPDAFTLSASSDSGDHGDCLVADFHCGVGIRHEIVKPGRIGA